jgi:hypothetical protein
MFSSSQLLVYLTNALAATASDPDKSQSGSESGFEAMHAGPDGRVALGSASLHRPFVNVQLVIIDIIDIFDFFAIMPFEIHDLFMLTSENEILCDIQYVSAQALLSRLNAAQCRFL